jgi:TorA maturation chaperone TorD
LEGALTTGEDAHRPGVDPASTTSIAQHDVPEEDVLRARFYGLLARLLAKPMSAETFEIVRALKGDESELGRALDALATIANKTTREAAEDEYTVLFYGMGAGGEFTPCASYYLTGLVYEKPLANLRADLARLGIAASPDLGEPEDHIAFLCEVMHGLITGAFGAADLGQQRDFFKAHIAPWAGRFFADLEGSKAAVLFMAVGTVGRLFMAIENEVFAMAA